MRSLRLFVCVFAVYACSSGEGYFIKVTTPEGRTPGPYRLGDTVNLIATEWHQRPYAPDEPTVNSVNSPDSFTWTSQSPSSAQIVAPGRVFVKQTGTVSFAVKTRRSSTKVVEFQVQP